MKTDQPLKLRIIIGKLVDDHPDGGAAALFLGWIDARMSAELAPQLTRFRYRSEVGIHTVRDLLIDALADLFERNESGQFVRIRAFYKDSLHWDTIPEKELEIRTRQMVRRSVSDALFRLYRSADPELARIIRNVKRGLTNRSDVSMAPVFRRLCVMAADQPVVHGQAWGIDELASRFARAFTQQHGLGWVLDEVASLLLAVPQGKANFIPVSVLGLAYRAALVALEGEIDDFETNPGVSSRLEQEDVLGLINRAVDRTLIPLSNRYVSKGKLKPQEAHGLQKGIRLKLHSLVRPDKDDHTFATAVAQTLPGTCHTVYRKQYRNVFEYFHKQAIGTLAELVEQERRHEPAFVVGSTSPRPLLLVGRR